MADDIDKAQELEEMERERAIEAARITGNERLTGTCHWCDEPTRGMFCSPECRNDYNQFQRMNA